MKLIKKINCENSYCSKKKVARLYVKAEKREPQEEDSFNTWMDVCVITHAIETRGVTWVIKQLQDNFTITRKP